MITFPCAFCGATVTVADELAGTETRCECGAPLTVPVELDLDEGPVPPDAQTMTVDELRALRQRSV